MRAAKAEEEVADLVKKSQQLEVIVVVLAVIVIAIIIIVIIIAVIIVIVIIIVIVNIIITRLSLTRRRRSWRRPPRSWTTRRKPCWPPRWRSTPSTG